MVLFLIGCVVSAFQIHGRVFNSICYVQPFSLRYVLINARVVPQVPLWHGQELLHSASMDAVKISNSNNTNTNADDVVRWRHVQAVVRLVQTVHLMSDVVRDWDCIVDAFEQLINYFCIHSHSTMKVSFGNAGASNSSNFTVGSTNLSEVSISNTNISGSGTNKSITSMETEKIFTAIERFKSYTVFMSDDTLTRLMTSLVALSMNNLAVYATASVSSSDNGEQRSAETGQAADKPTTGKT